MQVIQESVDKEFFIDIVVNEIDIAEISLGKMISTELRVGKEAIFLGIRKFTRGEEDAIEKREIKKSHK